MKKIFLSFFAAALCSSASAITWNFTTEFIDPPPLKFLTSSDPVYTSTTGAGGTQFNIISGGYNPATMLVTAATVTFWFADDEPTSDSEERVDIYVNGTSVTGTKVIANQEVNGSHPQANFAPYSANLQDFPGLLASIQDGILEYQVVRTTGDTYLKIASISATGTSRTVGVPDGGATVAMLGLSLLGLAVLRKRL